MTQTLAFALLGLSLPLSTLAASSDPFTDVSFTEHPFGFHIADVKESGIIGGYDDGTYRPELTINRAEFTKIVVAAEFSDDDIVSCDASTIQMTDVGLNDWFTGFVCTAQKEGVIAGYPDGSFRPSQHINFAEASKIIATVFGFPLVEEDFIGVWWRPYINALSRNDILPPVFRGADASVTRGEMAYMISSALRVRDGELETLALTESIEEPEHLEIDYHDYADGVLDLNEPLVLFFYASWCPFCSSHDRWLRDYYNQHVDGLSISTYKVDLDTETDLRRRFEVSVQDTFLLLNQEGELVETLIVPSNEELGALFEDWLE